MDAATWILIAAAVVLVVALIAWAVAHRRRTSHLQDRFGPEYERTVEQADSRREAHADLRERERRRDELVLRTLSPATAERYTSSWHDIQARFVDTPAEAVLEGDALVTSLMREVGYPVDDAGERTDYISVDHPDLVPHYRGAHGIAERSRRGQAGTEDLRRAMVDLRAVFEDILGERATDTTSTSAADGSRAGERRR
jgi:hypothetical protein